MKRTPTLFIALGGTGAEIAFRLRRRILTHAWGDNATNVLINDLHEFPLAEFIYYDLDTTSYLERRDTGSDPLSNLVRFSDDERLTSKLDIDKYFRNDDEIYKYPLIREWYPLTRKKLLDVGIEAERAYLNIRAFSRLYFFDKYKRLKDLIQIKITLLLNNLSNSAALGRLGIKIEPASLRIVVITSAAGGTGSGSFLDMGYLAKWLAKKQLLGAKVDLCLMLPSECGYSAHGKSRTEANTYAALMELESCMEHGIQLVKGWSAFESEYPDLPRTPYDDVFLLDTGNLALRKKEEVTDLFDMVADTLFEDFIPSDFSMRKNAIRVCHAQYKFDSFSLPVDHTKYGSMKMKYSKTYSAFGQSIIETQLKQVQDGIACKATTDNPLIKMLEEMLLSERRALFQNCLESAMPWVEANVAGIWAVNPDQYMCVVGVDGVAIFAQRFGDEFKSSVPTRAGMPATKINFYESGIPGKLTCYVELSGIPLTALNQLPKWRESYEEESQKIPVNIHKDRTLFVHPLAPSAVTLDRVLAVHFKLFIQGVVLGVLKARVDDPQERVYCLKVSGEELSIGNERSIRMGGLASGGLLHDLQRKVADALDQIKSPAQYSGLVALYDFYTKCVYPPAIVRDEGWFESVQEGFSNVMCRQLGEEAQKVLGEKFPNTDSGLIVRLRDILENWTDEIDCSESDVYEHEVGRPHMAKRSMKPECFQSGWPKITVHADEGSAKLKICLNCGEKVGAGSKYCPNCGSKFSDIPPPLPFYNVPPVD